MDTITRTLLIACIIINGLDAVLHIYDIIETTRMATICNDEIDETK